MARRSSAATSLPREVIRTIGSGKIKDLPARARYLLNAFTKIPPEHWTQTDKMCRENALSCLRRLSRGRRGRA